MKILITPDVDNWAIGSLTDLIIKNNERFCFERVAVHPKEIASSFVELQDILKKGDIDMWHAQYWNSALQMMRILPELAKIPCMLTHQNHHSLDEGDWHEFKTLIAPTNYSVEKLRRVHGNVIKIPHAIDLDRFSYIEDYGTDEPTLGYVGRVVPWKNLARVCSTAKKLGYKVIGSGFIDKPQYWATVDKSVLEFHGGIGRNEMAPADFKDDLYRKMTVFVMYSTDEKESGTLPLLEAMARGIPVMATEQGMARDLIEDGKNGILFNENNFEEKVKMLVEDKDLREKLRINAWETIKEYSDKRFSLMYQKAYYKTLFGDKKLISVVIPTFDRPDTLWEVIKSIEENEYDAKEIIIVEDGSKNNITKELILECKKSLKTNILYLNTHNRPEYYGLAQARNMGAIEALGDIILFLDDRYTLHKDALKNIADQTETNTFHFGQKVVNNVPSTKRAFIENFAWIYRSDFMKTGMFCERMNIYGGMSQEIRERMQLQGVETKFNPQVVADVVLSTPKRKKRNEVWKAKHLIYKMYG